MEEIELIDAFLKNKIDKIDKIEDTLEMLLIFSKGLDEKYPNPVDYKNIENNLINVVIDNFGDSINDLLKFNLHIISILDKIVDNNVLNKYINFLNESVNDFNKFILLDNLLEIDKSKINRHDINDVFYILEEKKLLNVNDESIKKSMLKLIFEEYIYNRNLKYDVIDKYKDDINLIGIQNIINSYENLFLGENTYFLEMVLLDGYSIVDKCNHCKSIFDMKKVDFDFYKNEKEKTIECFSTYYNNLQVFSVLFKDNLDYDKINTKRFISTLFSYDSYLINKKENTNKYLLNAFAHIMNLNPTLTLNIAAFNRLEIIKNISGNNNIINFKILDVDNIQTNISNYLNNHDLLNLVNLMTKIDFKEKDEYKSFIKLNYSDELELIEKKLIEENDVFLLNKLADENLFIKSSKLDSSINRKRRFF